MVAMTDRTAPAPPVRRIDTAGLHLKASVVDTRVMAFWARQAQRKRATIGTVSLAEIDK